MAYAEYAMEDFFITADWVLPITSAPIERGGVIVRAGVIEAIGTVEALRESSGGVDGSLREIDLGRAALMPGLVNTHAHLELTGLRGFLEETDFFAWIRKLTDTKYERLDADDILLASRWGVAEATRAGVTTIGDICDFGVSVRALADGGLRGVVFQEVFGPDPAQAAPSIAGLEAKLAQLELVDAPRLAVGVSPHAPYTVSPELFQLVTALALESRLPMAIHTAESRAELDFVRHGKGPFADYLASREIEVLGRDCSTVEWLDNLGVLAAQPLLVHAVYCDRDDLRRVADSGSKIAHCPKANAKLRHGVAPWREMRESVVVVGLGSDGVICNNSLDLFEEARFAALMDRARIVDTSSPDPEVPDAAAILRMMTLGGAEALGLAERVGSLDPGKAADLCAVDLSTAAAGPVHDVETAVVWSASARDVVLTVVDGEILWDGERYARWDLDVLGRSAGELPEKLRRRIEGRDAARREIPKASEAVAQNAKTQML